MVYYAGWRKMTGSRSGFRILANECNISVSENKKPNYNSFKLENFRKSDNFFSFVLVFE